MITEATMSILGLYRADNTIFSEMTLPDEITTHLNDYLVYENILLQYAELEVLYPDPDVMKHAISIWSKSRLHTWNRMAEVLYEDYDPYINIKRDERREITQTRNLASSGEAENKVSAWNLDVAAGNCPPSSTDTGTVSTIETFHVEGDSAITDAQDVLRKEMEVRIAYDLIDIIVREFKERFLLQIY